MTLDRPFRSFIFHLGFESQNPRKQEQSWQNKGTTQFTDSQSPSSTSFNTQKFVAQPQSWQSKIRFSPKTHILFSSTRFSNHSKSRTFNRYNFFLLYSFNLSLLNAVEQNEQAFMETTTPTQIGVRFQGLFGFLMGVL